MSFFKITGFAVTALICILLLKRLKEEYALFVSLFAGIALTVTAVYILKPLIEYTDSIGSVFGNSGIIPLIFKATGISVIGNIACDLCRDSGEQALASRLELCASAIIISLALPLIKNIFDICLELLE